MKHHSKKGFTRKYSKYLEELQKLKPVSQAIPVTRKEENQATSKTNQPWQRLSHIQSST